VAVHSGPDALEDARRFVAEKQPRTDVERVVCLGYCLDRFSGLKEFASTDVTRLNDELGLPRLSNPSFAVRKARTRGFFAQGEHYRLQITDDGKAVVESLPR